MLLMPHTFCLLGGIEEMMSGLAGEMEGMMTEMEGMMTEMEGMFLVFSLHIFSCNSDF